MKLKRLLKGTALVLGAIALVAAVYVAVQVRAFNQSMSKVYDVPVLNVARSDDAAVVARGKHLAESVAGCATTDCHGNDLGGGRPITMGPLGTVVGPNITSAGERAASYSDGELARLIVHGIKRDGRSVIFMPSQDLSWLPDDELRALISFLKQASPVSKPDGETRLGLLAKVLDRRGLVQIDIARQIDHQNRATAPAPAPTAIYGAFLVRACQGCHGARLSGGRIPGTPASIPVPLNITPHETGLKGWTYVDFNRLLTEGLKKDGKKVDPFMPIEALGKMNEIERQALWAYLSAAPPVPFGSR